MSLGWGGGAAYDNNNDDAVVAAPSDDDVDDDDDVGNCVEWLAIVVEEDCADASMMLCRHEIRIVIAPFIDGDSSRVCLFWSNGRRRTVGHGNGKGGRPLSVMPLLLLW